LLACHRTTHSFLLTANTPVFFLEGNLFLFFFPPMSVTGAWKNIWV
jgi:hypothetical protein